MKDFDSRHETGAVLIIVALTIVGLFGMLALVVDVGALISMKGRLTTAADSAALAAAQSCAKPYESGAAQAQANDLATSNVSQAESISYSALGCGVADSGEVDLSYKAAQRLYFASIIGGPNQIDVSVSATAIWGVAGAARPIPIAIDSTELRAPTCGIPLAAVGTQCAFWFDPSDLGDSGWGLVNFHRWNVSSSLRCSEPSSGDLRTWLRRGFDRPLPLNYPAPTRVCNGGSGSSNVWSTLRGRRGEVVHIPVNNPVRELPGPPSEPDKYDIIGFTPLEVVALLDGDDPEAVGQLTKEADCLGVTDLAPLDTFSLDGTGCYLPPAAISNLKISKGDVVFTEGVDYVFDPLTRTVEWISPETVNNVTVSFHWLQQGFAGKCGMRPPNGEAKCLVIEWTGSRTGGFDPRGGANFGLFAVRLSA